MVVVIEMYSDHHFAIPRFTVNICTNEDRNTADIL